MLSGRGVAELWKEHFSDVEKLEFSLALLLTSQGNVGQSLAPFGAMACSIRSWLG